MNDVQKVIVSYEQGAYTRIGYLVELLRVAMLWGAAEFKKDLPEQILPEFREFLSQVVDSGELPLMAKSTLRLLASRKEFKELLRLLDLEDSASELTGFVPSKS
jgi:hypothetical protein